LASTFLSDYNFQKEAFGERGGRGRKKKRGGRKKRPVIGRSLPYPLTFATEKKKKRWQRRGGEGEGKRGGRKVPLVLVFPMRSQKER